MKRLALVILFAGIAGAQPLGQYDGFVDRWNAFVLPMNAYIQSLSRGEVDYRSLRIAVHKWRALERDERWNEIK